MHETGAPPYVNFPHRETNREAVRDATRISDDRTDQSATREEDRMAQSTIEDQAAPDETVHGGSLLFSGCVAGLAGGVAMAAYLVFAARTRNGAVDSPRADGGHLQGRGRTGRR